MRHDEKALRWLERHQVPVEFHDYKSRGIAPATVNEWARQVGWETLLNRKGLTWRRLDEQTKDRVRNAAAAVAIMCSHPSVIRRPVLERKGKVLAVGFAENEYQAAFGVAR